MDRGQDSGLSKAPGHQTLSHANPTAISHTHSSCRIIGLMLGELLLSVTVGGRWEPWGRLSVAWCCLLGQLQEPRLLPLAHLHRKWQAACREIPLTPR